ncbi:hypothetical protein DFS34DRAFT_651984 [Phlyctochytrium arcticum]|nr:hypothetical protein DFS34DRAFT_651984 [Phlyctochytrium arcticum]
MVGKFTSVVCPVCATDLGCDTNKATLHVNRCLDKIIHGSVDARDVPLENASDESPRDYAMVQHPSIESDIASLEPMNEDENASSLEEQKDSGIDYSLSSTEQCARDVKPPTIFSPEPPEPISELVVEIHPIYKAEKGYSADMDVKEATFGDDDDDDDKFVEAETGKDDSIDGGAKENTFDDDIDKFVEAEEDHSVDFAARKSIPCEDGDKLVDDLKEHRNCSPQVENDDTPFADWNSEADSEEEQLWNAIDLAASTTTSGDANKLANAERLLEHIAATLTPKPYTSRESPEPNDPEESNTVVPTGNTGTGFPIAPGRKCPWYKKMPQTTFSVDAFMYGRIEGIQAYFLSHFHADHYGGLNKNFNYGPIYCSVATGNLVIQRLRVNPEFVIKLPMETPVEVMGNRVTLIDANHCPGAVLFLFEIPTSGGKLLRYLHTGDFRAHKSHLEHPLVRAGRLDIIYLDTTYCRPSHRFPSQEEVVEAIVELTNRVCMLGQTVQHVVVSGGEARPARKQNAAASMLQKWVGWTGLNGVGGLKKSTDGTLKQKSRTLVLCGSYTIGKEKVFVAIAKALGTTIFTSSEKRRVLHALHDPELTGLLSTAPYDSAVHVVSMRGLKAEEVKDYMMHHKLCEGFDAVICIRPTGWTYRPSANAPAGPLERYHVGSLRPSHSTIHVQQMPPKAKGSKSRRGSTPSVGPIKTKSVPISTIPLPYSEHSSFDELQEFITTLAASKGGVGKVIPTVRGSKIHEIDDWCRKWLEEGRRSV